MTWRVIGGVDRRHESSKKRAMQRGLLREVISGRMRPSILRSGLYPVLARWQSNSVKDGKLRKFTKLSDQARHAIGITSNDSQQSR